MSGRRALVIDDDADSVGMLETLLRLSGHDPRGAHDGKSALALAASFAPEVVFLDLSLPDLDGFQVARILRLMPGLERSVLVALTGWSDPETKERAKECGFHHVLVKPFELRSIEAILAGPMGEAPRG